MATILRDDGFMRRGRRPPRKRQVSALVFILVFCSLALLVLSRLDHPVVQSVRDAAMPVVAPVLSWIATPLAPVRGVIDRTASAFVSHDELARLKAENQQLRSWEWRARDLERQLMALGRAAKRVEAPQIRYLTTQVIADSTGPFARSVVIDAGESAGVRVGHPVINADGVVGRVVHVADNVARVLLLSDINSRVPVAIGPNGVRAIAFGDNGGRPAFKHLPRDARIGAGDVVATSGRGGLYPRALRIGEVVATSDGFALQPFANLSRLDFVSVLLFDSPVRALADQSGTSNAAPRPRAEGE